MEVFERQIKRHLRSISLNERGFKTLKRLRSFLILTLVCSLVWLSGCGDSLHFHPGLNCFELTDEDCGRFFNGPVRDFETEADWMRGNYVNYYIENNKFNLCLTDEQMKIWREYFVEFINKEIRDTRENMGCELIVNEDFTNVEFYGTEEYSVNSLMIGAMTSSACHAVQLFSGNDKEKTSVYLTIYDIETNEVIWEDSIPTDFTGDPWNGPVDNDG